MATSLCTTEVYFVALKKHFYSLESSRKGHKKLWEKEPYFSRRKKIQTRCSNLSLHRRIDLARMIYDDHHHSIMCVVPKVLLNRAEERSALT